MTPAHRTPWPPRTRPAILALLAASILAATAPLAQEARRLEAHMHGLTHLDLAIERGRLTLDLRAPGMDIVGFEHAATGDADRDAVAAAIRALQRPESVITLPRGASCRLQDVAVHLRGGDDGAHGGDDAHDAGHAEDHRHDGHDGHDEPAAQADHAAQDGHDGQEGHDDHDGPEGDDGQEVHDGQEGQDGHREFHARYVFDCADPAALGRIGFAFFATFPAAQRIVAQFVTETGAGRAEIRRESPALDLRN